MTFLILILMFVLWKLFKFSLNVLFPLLVVTLILLWLVEVIKVLFPIIIIVVGGYLVYHVNRQRS